jgi:hypothetical protein
LATFDEHDVLQTEPATLDFPASQFWQDPSDVEPVELVDFPASQL